ncbi:transposase [Actinacidiphila acidipaludis]|uniref:Transposase n=1 Tax=Actinacidiphila acidipaludis TaxID=2873382 RepID=A0ABS7QES6_9ACTN|nr:transposase [Streptomyces acidipaludis]
MIVADAGYSQDDAFRQGVAERGLDFGVAVRADEAAHRHEAVPSAPAWSGTGRKPTARYQSGLVIERAGRRRRPQGLPAGDLAQGPPKGRCAQSSRSMSCVRQVSLPV